MSGQPFLVIPDDVSWTTLHKYLRMVCGHELQPAFCFYVLYPIYPFFHGFSPYILLLLVLHSCQFRGTAAIPCPEVLASTTWRHCWLMRTRVMVLLPLKHRCTLISWESLLCEACRDWDSARLLFCPLGNPNPPFELGQCLTQFFGVSPVSTAAACWFDRVSCYYYFLPLVGLAAIVLIVNHVASTSITKKISKQVTK